MTSQMNNHLMILEVEKNQVKTRLRDEIKSIRYTLNNLESKLDDDRFLYDSDGLQGNGVYLDACLSKIVAYEKSIKRFKAHLNKDK